MNREILFRGKRLDNDEWVEGVYFPPAHTIITLVNSGTEESPNYEDYVVLQETAGQYIGLNDRQDKPIFEGDIVEVDEEEVPFLIEYNEQDAIWLASNRYGILSFRDNITGDDCTIIGNVYDNPNLLSK